MNMYLYFNPWQKEMLGVVILQNKKLRFLLKLPSDYSIYLGT
jgi:hypothetical protein